MSGHHDVVLDQGLIIEDTDGGPGFLTEIVRGSTGISTRFPQWDEDLGAWERGDRQVNDAELQYLQDFFKARWGQTYTFLWRDWGDYKVLAAQGRLGMGAVGTGLPTYELWRRNGDASGHVDKRIWRPETVTVYRDDVEVDAGSGAGEVAVTLIGGTVTFVADASQGISAITPGASTQITIAANLGLAGGELLHLSGLAGADAGLLNGTAPEVASITGSGPYTVTLDVDTAGKTITAGSGVAALYPQPSEELNWSGQFYKVVRFGTDRLRRNFLVRSGEEMLFYVASLPLVEERNP